MKNPAPQWIVVLNRLLLVVLVLYLLYAGVMFSLQRRALYPGVGQSADPNAFAQDSTVAEFWVQSGADSIDVRYLPPTGASDGSIPSLLIFAHGSRSQIGQWATRFDSLRAIGFGVLLPEFPGYGLSSGKPTQTSLTEAFVAAYDGAVEQDLLDTNRVVLMGHSLGSGVICQLATRRPSSAMILAAPFVSSRTRVARFFLPGFIVRDPWDNMEVVREYDQPLLVVHGRNDKVISIGHGVTLYEAAKHGALMSGPGDHTNPVGNWNTLWVEARPFLAACGLTAQPVGVPALKLSR